MKIALGLFLVIGMMTTFLSSNVLGKGNFEGKLNAHYKQLKVATKVTYNKTAKVKKRKAGGPVKIELDSKKLIYKHKTAIRDYEMKASTDNDRIHLDLTFILAEKNLGNFTFRFHVTWDKLSKKERKQFQINQTLFDSSHSSKILPQ